MSACTFFLAAVRYNTYRCRYVLEKDVLKFEAIYPKDQEPLGQIRGLNIYPRSSLHHLEGSLNWMKHARMIKVIFLRFYTEGCSVLQFAHNFLSCFHLFRVLI